VAASPVYGITSALTGSARLVDSDTDHSHIFYDSSPFNESSGPGDSELLPATFDFEGSDSVVRSFDFGETHSLSQSNVPAASSPFEGTAGLGRTNALPESDGFAGSDLVANVRVPSANRFTATAVSLAVGVGGVLVAGLLVMLFALSRKKDRDEWSEYSEKEMMADLTAGIFGNETDAFANDDAEMVTQLNCLTLATVTPGSLWIGE
jgi:hypothetical protein